MSIKVEINAQSVDTETPLQLHYLPAKIEGDGPTNVEDFFNVYTRQQPGGTLTNALRGFPLQGVELPVPDGYKGIVLQETHKPLDEDAERQLRAMGSFDKFHYWNYDKVPSKADAYRQALQVIDIAKELAQPISASEVDAEMERHKQKLEKSEEKDS